MKRSMILGICGLVFAAGSAFTSVADDAFASRPFVKIRQTAGGAISCTQAPTNIQCADLTSGTDCLVQVQTQQGLQTVRGYKSGCAVIMKTGTQPVDVFTPSNNPYEAVN